MALTFTFFKSKQASLNDNCGHSLSQVFRYEEFELLDDKLLSLHTVSELIKENRDARKAWQFEHVPEKHLRKIIARWLELMARKEAFVTKINKLAKDLTEIEIQEIAYAISQDKLGSIKDYNDNLTSNYEHLIYLECLNKVDFYLNVLGILLVAIDKEFGIVSSSALDLSSALGIIMSSLMMVTDLLTLCRIYYRNRSLEPKHYLEIGFLIFSIVLNGCGIISSAPMLTVLAGSMSVIQSLVELWGECSRFAAAPYGTERKTAHLQECLALAIRCLHGLISLILVSIMLSSAISILPSMIGLCTMTAGLLAWNIMPEPWRRYFKIHFGLSKKSYFVEESCLPQESTLLLKG